MTRTIRQRTRRFFAVFGAVALSAGLTAAALPPALTSSTPAPIDSPQGMLMSYVANTQRANPAQIAATEKAIAESGGIVVQSWPAIGVVVAQSTSATFREDVWEKAGDVLSSLGATRSMQVSETVPMGTAPRTLAMHSVWDAGAGDVAAPPTPAQSIDPFQVDQWDLAMIGADKAQAVTDGSPNVLVGVLDSGIDPDHPDLAAKISLEDSVNCTLGGQPDTSPTGWYPTSSDHGTHVAGTIAAARNNQGMVGVAPAVRLAAVKVVNDDGFIYPEYAVCGFMWAAERHMDVTNNSYFIDPFMFYCEDQGDQAAALQAVRRAVAYATKAGVTNVAAAGNESTDLTDVTVDYSSPNDGLPLDRDLDAGCMTIPGELPGMIVVSSVTEDGELSGFSNRGLDAVDVAAPGSEILSAVIEDNSYGLMSGTSMASPHVAGVVALMKSAHPEFSPAQIRAKIMADAVDIPCPAAGVTGGPECVGDATNNSFFGQGLVNAEAAVQ